jgi:hypothetical protein
MRPAVSVRSSNHGETKVKSADDRTASSRTIADEREPTEQAGPPQPDPALRRLDRYVGTWALKGRTLDSQVDNVSGTTTFEWLPGGFFLQQHITLNFAGYEIDGLELIGYDPATGTFPSTVFANTFGTPIPYRWEVEGDVLKITTEMLGATFRGKWSKDGTSFSGGWRPDPGREGPGNTPYDVWGTRAK